MRFQDYLRQYLRKKKQYRKEQQAMDVVTIYWEPHRPLQRLQWSRKIRKERFVSTDARKRSYFLEK